MTTSGPREPAPLPAGTVEASVRALIVRQGTGGTASHHGASAAGVCSALTEHFSRLLGSGGVRVLFERSVVLTEAQLPSLSGPRSQAADPPWTQLLERVSRAPHEVALDASALLVTTFVCSLAQLIGADLALKLIREIWPDDFAAFEEEETP